MKIKMLVMDVDGTLTDGKIYIGQEGEMFKAFDVKDGYGIARILPCNGIVPVIITGRSSVILEKRCEELKIKHLYQGIEDKISKLKEVIREMDICIEEVAYIGDDLNDLDCMKACGFVGCPADAVDSVIDIADYKCKRCGGNGAVREFIDFIVAKDKNENK